MTPFAFLGEDTEAYLLVEIVNFLEARLQGK